MQTQPRTETEIEAFLAASSDARLPLQDFQARVCKLSTKEREIAEGIWSGRVNNAYWNRGEMATIAEETRYNYIRAVNGRRAP